MRALILLLPALLFGQAKFNQIRIITSMDGTAPGQIEFDTSRADNKAVVLKAPTTATAGYSLTLPIAAPATTGHCLTGTTGGVLSFSSCLAGGVTSITGTANQVIASASTGAVTLSLPQSIHATATPQFGGVSVVAGSTNVGYTVTDGTITGLLFASGLGGIAVGATSAHPLILYGHNGERARATSTGFNVTGTLAATSTATITSHILTTSPSNADIGSATNYFQTLYVENIDAAPAGIANSYLRARKFELYDIAGSAYAFWDQRVNATSVTSAWTLRDNSGSRALQFNRQVVSSAANYVSVFGAMLPAKRATASGDAVNDSVYPELGNTTDRWAKAWTYDLSATGVVQLGTTSTIGYVWKATDTAGTGGWAADSAGQWTTSGSDIYYNTGSVGIGTASPAHKLDVLGTSAKIYAGGTTTDTTLHVGNSDVALPGQGGFLTFHASAATPYLSINALSQGVANRNISLAPLGGNVGIGTTNPAYKLDVSGTLNATGAATLGAGLAVTGNLSFTGTLNTAISTTELGYLDGVTSAIQTQLGARALTSTTISTTSPLTGGGDLSTNRTFACATCATTDTTQTISGSKTFSGAVTMGANFLANAASAFDIGDATNYFQTVYAENGDFTNGSVPNQYLKTRKLEIADIAGSSGFWDHRSQASFVSNSSYTIRDNGGSRWLAASRAVSGSPTNSTTVFTDWVPALRSTGSGDAVSDSTLPALGATGFRWSTAFVNLLDATASLSLYPSGSVFLGALGNDWNRLWVGGVEATSFVRPQTDNGGTSGTAVRRWSTTYTNNLKADGTVNLGTSSTVGYVWKATDTAGTGGWAADSAGQWTTSGSYIYYNTGNVGIGTTVPTSKLTIVDTAQSATNNPGNAGLKIYGTATNVTSPEFINVGYDPTLLVGYVQAVRTGTGGAYLPLALNPNGNNVGIGDSGPSQKLTIGSGNAVIRGTDNFASAGALLYLGDTNHGIRANPGLGVTLFTAGIANGVFLQQYTGSVGIGTASPAYKLDVSGTLNATGAATLGAGLAVSGNLSFTGTLNTAISTTELGYLDGVTSAIQTQFSARALTSTQIFTTSPLTGGGDLSTNRTFACSTCFTTAGGTMTGNLVVNTNLSVGGDYFPISDLGADLGSASLRFGGIFHAGGDNYGSHRTRFGANLTIMSGGAVYADAGSSVDFSGTVTTGGSSTYSGTTSCGSGQAVKTITVSRGLVTAVTCGTP
jgi:hypothetical protein